MNLKRAARATFGGWDKQECSSLLFRRRSRDKQECLPLLLWAGRRQVATEGLNIAGERRRPNDVGCRRLLAGEHFQHVVLAHRQHPATQTNDHPVGGKHADQPVSFPDGACFEPSSAPVHP